MGGKVVLRTAFIKFKTTHTYPKINSKLIKQQNIRVETIKVLEEITRQKLHDTGLGNDTYGTDNKRENRKTGLRED